MWNQPCWRGRKNIDELSPEQPILLALVLLLAAIYSRISSSDPPEIQISTQQKKSKHHPELETWTICLGCVLGGWGKISRERSEIPPGKKEHHRLKSAFLGDMLVSGRVAFAQSQTSPYFFNIFPCPNDADASCHAWSFWHEATFLHHTAEVLSEWRRFCWGVK